MRLSLGQRFWIFAVLFAVVTAAAVGVFVTQQVGDYRRHTRTLELTEWFHAVIAARGALASEYQSTQHLVGHPVAGSDALRRQLAERRRATDAALRAIGEDMRDTSVAGPAQAREWTRRAEAALERGRATVDRELAVPVGERTAAGTAAALRADTPISNDLLELLDLAETELRSNDPGSALNVGFVRLTADVHDRASRQALDLVPAIVAGTPLTDGLRRRLSATRGQIEYAGLLVARRGTFFEQDDPEITPAIARIQDDDYPVVDTMLNPAELAAAGTTASIDRLAGAIDERAHVAADLTDAATDLGAERAQEGRDRALFVVSWSLAAAGLVLVALILFVLWSRRAVLAALESTTRELIALTQGDTSQPPDRRRKSAPELEALYAAVADLRQKERHRARLEAERTALHQQLRHEATTDALTGLFNRRAVDDIGARWASGAEGAGAPLGIILADIDHFKAINDTHGHLVGDRVLEIAARRLAAAVRPSDTVARYGGEEFLILAADIESDALWRLAEDLRCTVGDHRFAVDGTEPLEVRISAGIVHARQGECGWSEVLAAADSALYRAKATGRNRVEVGLLAEVESGSLQMGPDPAP